MLFVNPLDLEGLIWLAHETRKDIVNMIYNAGSGHPGGSLSSVELLWSLYYYTSRNAINRWEDRHRIVLSKGHAAPTLYSIAGRLGYLDKNVLKPFLIAKNEGLLDFVEQHSYSIDLFSTLRKLNSPLQGHSDMNKCPIVEISTGSLGVGIGAAEGMAIAGLKHSPQYNVHVVVGDGELQTGPFWETIWRAPQQYNLTIHFDWNGLQIDNPVGNIFSALRLPYDLPIADKGLFKPSRLMRVFEEFGWDVQYIREGHNFTQILEAIHRAELNTARASVILYNTVKGKGISFMENNLDFHGRAPTEEEYERAMKELNSIKLPSGNAEGIIQLYKNKILSQFSIQTHTPSKILRPIFKPNNKPKATRVAFAEMLYQLMKISDRIIPLNADLGASVGHSLLMKEYGVFTPHTVDGRVGKEGIAEFSMLAKAAGLATAGYIPVPQTFGVFGMRGYEVIKYPISSAGLNVKIGLTHMGCQVAGDGDSHQPYEVTHAVSILPNIRVFEPYDASNTHEIAFDMLTHVGPDLIGLTRSPVKYLPTPAKKTRSFAYFRPHNEVNSSTPDLYIIASGATVAEAYDAADELSEYDVAVVAITWHNPPSSELKQLGRLIDSTVPIMTVYDGSPRRLPELIGQATGYYPRGHNYGFNKGESGSIPELYNKFEISAQKIIENARAFLE